MGFDMCFASAQDVSRNALIIETIFFGIYTLICGYTLWRLVLRKSRYAYLFCLAGLWALVTFTIVLDWLRDWRMQSNTFLIIADFVLFEPTSWNSANEIVSTLVTIIADALLVYRCYIVCGNRNSILVGLGAFLAADLVVGILEFLPLGSLPLGLSRLSPLRERLFDFSYYLIGLCLSSAIVTSIGTFLISHRILSTTRDNLSIANLSVYRKIRRIVIESGVIYAINMLITGITLVALSAVDSRTPFTSSDGVLEIKICVALTYSQTLLTPLSGIVPTLIALRVVTQTAQTEEDVTKPVSHLIFRRSSPQSDIDTFSPNTQHSFMQFVSNHGSGSRSENASTTDPRVTVSEGPSSVAIVDNPESQNGRSAWMDTQETV